MIPFWLLGLGSRFLAWVPALISACLEVLIRPAAWLLIGLSLFGGYVYGGSVQKAVCASERAASIEAAQAVDRKAAEDARTAAAEQKQASDARMAEAERQIQEYADALAQKPSLGCSLDDDDLARLDRMQSKRVPGRPARPTLGGRRDPGSGGLR